MLETAIKNGNTGRTECPSCGRNEKERTFSVKRDERGLVGHCFRCGLVQTEFTRTEYVVPPKPEIHQTLGVHWREFWKRCQPVKGTIGETYLQSRGCAIPPADGDLRFAPKVPHWIAHRDLPALVALCTDAVTKEPRTLHFTYLQTDGSGKAAVDPARLLLAKHIKAGAVIRLWPDEAVSIGLAIAEGIETALALAHAYMPAWAAIDASNLKSFPVLPGVEALMIGVDFDHAGIDAAEACMKCWKAAGREVYLLMPDYPGSDLADEVKP